MVKNRRCNLPHLYLAPLSGWPRWDFAEIYCIHKLELLACSQAVIGLSSSVESRLVTDGHTITAYSALLPQRRGKISSSDLLFLNNLFRSCYHAVLARCCPCNDPAKSHSIIQVYTWMMPYTYGRYQMSRAGAVDSIAVRRVWQQFSRLNPSVYSAALRGGCCVPPCVADVIVNCAVCQQFNKRTLVLLFQCTVLA